MDPPNEPKSDELWFFIARALYTGIISYLVLLGFAFIRDLLRRVHHPRRSTSTPRLSYDGIRSFLIPSSDTRVIYLQDFFRLILNLVICVLYVIGTFRQNVVPYITVLNRIFVALFMYDVIEHTIFAESAIAYVSRVVIFFDAFTYPSLILASGPNHYLNFSFLRSTVAYAAFIKLEKRLFIQVLGSRRIFIKLMFQFVALFYTLAAGIQLLEIPGDLLSVEFRDKWFNFGDWNFINACYFIIVTLSTVGYGDFSPVTIQGRIFTLFIIIVGIVVFTTVIAELVEQASRGRGSGWFVKNSHTRHVIVTGTPNMTDLVHFISEFYSDSRLSNIEAKIVVMVAEPLWSDTEWFHHIARNQFLQARLQFLVGSVRNQLDLQRARISSADAIFILTSASTGEKPSIQDGRTIINALAIRNVRTDIPIYAQTLLEDSNLQAQFALKTASSFAKEETYFRGKHMAKHCEYAGLFHKVLLKEFNDIPRAHKKEGRHCFEDVLRHFENRQGPGETSCMDASSTLDLDRSQHVCLQEIHMALVAGNIKANGVGTLLSNMYLDVRTTKLSKEDPSWLAEYHMGAACSLTYAVIPKALNEATVKDIAADLFHMGVLIIATSDPQKIQPRPVLGTDMFLRYGDLVLLLTYHEYKYVWAALHLVSIRYTRGELRHSLSSSTGSSAIPASVMDRTVTHTRSSYDADDRPGKGAEESKRPCQSLGNFLAPAPAATHFSNVSGDDLDALADAAMCNGDEARGLLSSNTCEALLEKKSDGYMPDSLSGHVILAMEGDAPLGNLPLLLRNLWRRGVRKSTQMGERVKVVVVHPSIDEHERKRYARFEGVSLFFVQGPPTSRATWKKARLNKARSVATLADFTKPWALSDARSIFTLLTLDVSTRIDHDLFICSELVDEKSLEFLREPIHPRRRGASLGESSDQVFGNPSALDADQFGLTPEKKEQNSTTYVDVISEVRTGRSQAHDIPARKADQKQAKDEKAKKMSRKMEMGRNFSAPDHKSVKSAEFKSFVKSAVPAPAAGEGESDDFGADPSARPGAARARRGTLFSRSRYASGELLVQSSAITLLAREYIEPGFVKFFTSLLGTEQSSPGMKIRLVRIPETMFEPDRGFVCNKGRKLVRYNDIFKILVKVGVTPIGIYRSGVAPVQIPSKVRRKRGPAIYEELEPLMSETGRAFRRGGEKALGILKRMSDFFVSIFDDVVPHRMREARGREELDGKVDDSSSDDFSIEEEEEEVVTDAQELDPSLNGALEGGGINEHRRVNFATPEMGSMRRDSHSPRRQHSSSLPTWLSPKRDPNASKFFYDDDDSLEVPGQVKYTERMGKDNLLPYVFTLPDPNTWCADRDGIFILCHPSFELPSKWTETTMEVNEPKEAETAVP